MPAPTKAVLKRALSRGLVMFSKVKALLRRAEGRTRAALIEAMGQEALQISLEHLPRRSAFDR